MEQSQVNAELMTWLREAKDAVEREAPLLAEEIVKWGMVSDAFSFLACIVLVIGFAIAARFFFREAKRIEEPEPFFLMIVCTGFAVLLLFGSGYYVKQFSKAYFVPRVYVVDYIAAKASK